MRITQLQRVLALLMVLLMMWGSTSALAATKAGQTISSDSKWINSDIIGAVDENTQVSLKDDFHTAVNLEWFLNDEEKLNSFELAEELLYERKLDIVLNQANFDPANADAIGLSSEWLKHDLKLVQNFSSLSGEWEYRNAYGIEPARPFLDAIASIKNMDELSDYLFNVNGMNITGFALAQIGVTPDPESQTTYVASVVPNSLFALNDQDEYLYIGENGLMQRFVNEEAVRYLLERLGYAEMDVARILRKCYRFESRLAECVQSKMQQQTSDYQASGTMLSLDELTALTGNYPIADQIENLGVEKQAGYLVFEQSYLKSLDKLYQPQYLEEIKAVLMVHTVRELLPLLDEEAYDKAADIYQAVSVLPKGDDSEPIGQNEPELADKRKDVAEFVFNNYLNNYLPGPMDQIYVATYCTPELKADIRTLIDDVIAYYREMIRNVEWLSENARNATVEKLDYMLVRCVYPDQFVDYTGLNFKGCRDNQGGTLPEAIAAINQFHHRRALAKIGKAVDRNEWDMSEPYKSTTVCNAYYMPAENSINILAGFVTENMYTPDMPYEKLLAIVGTVIGHEITHAFDTQGYKFNKFGQMDPWWSVADANAFDYRANTLIKYYDGIRPYPDAFMFYSGKNVSGEAIADMGAVKCMLRIAKNKPDFDYELFFRSYAELWRTQNTQEVEKLNAQDDVHPLAFLRTNVTLMQFEEFRNTFDIQPGDGMYLAPENQISVW